MNRKIETDNSLTGMGNKVNKLLTERSQKKR
jgi:hypothetical protein